MDRERPLSDSEIELVRGVIFKGYLQKGKTPKWVVSMRKVPIKKDELSQIMNDIKATFPTEAYKLDSLHKIFMQEGLI